MHADRLWLRRELQLHLASQSQLESTCLELENATLQMLAQLYGSDEVCRKTKLYNQLQLY
jgi:hypothetical protein